MKRRFFKAMLLSLFIISTASIVNASPGPEPVTVSWYVTDVLGNPIDGASLTIYWSTSPSGPFNTMPEDDGAGTYVYDKIGDVRRNPIYTGYWNPTYPHGMAVCDIHPKEGLNGLYFYVKIDYGTFSWYWPVATSSKPEDSSWQPVTASGSPTGYAAEGPGIGTGPTTAYPTLAPPEFVIPEATPIMAVVSMMIAFCFYVVTQKRKTPIL